MNIGYQSAAAGAAGGGLQGVVPVPEPRLDALESRLARMSNEVSTLISRARGLSDRLVGAVPESVGTTRIDTKGESSRPPALRRLESAADELNQLIGIASEQLARLENL